MVYKFYPSAWDKKHKEIISYSGMIEQAEIKTTLNVVFTGDDADMIERIRVNSGLTWSQAILAGLKLLDEKLKGGRK